MPNFGQPVRIQNFWNSKNSIEVWDIKLISCRWMYIHRSHKLMQFFLRGLWLPQECPKLFESNIPKSWGVKSWLFAYDYISMEATNWQSSYNWAFGRHPELISLIACGIPVPGITKVLSINRLGILQERVKE